MTRSGARTACFLGLGIVSLMACRQPQVVTPVPLPPLDATAVTPIHEGEYRLERGDVLRVKFLYHPELDVRVPIRPDGSITLQATGELAAAGLTTEELGELIVLRDISTQEATPEMLAELGIDGDDDKAAEAGSDEQKKVVAKITGKSVVMRFFELLLHE